MTHLEHLFLQALAGVTELPDLRRLERLRIVHLETMKRLTDLSPLTTAPALEHLDLIDMRHLTLDDLAPLVDHPTLRTTQFDSAAAARKRHRRGRCYGATDQSVSGIPDMPGPPSTEMVWPLRYDDASLARNRITEAISTG